MTLNASQPLLHCVMPAARAGAPRLGLCALLTLADRQMSTPQLSFRHALCFVTAWMLTGWAYLSLVTVIPAVVVTCIVSIGLSILSLASPRWHGVALHAFRHLLIFFQRNRMIQD